MLTTNRVAKLTGVRKVEICVEDVPEPGPQEMLVKIQAAGICGSDLHYFRHGGLGSFKQPLPMLLGHEPAGIVVDVNGHGGFSVGDRVAIEPGRPCFTSPWSLRGRHNLCKEGSFMGAAGQPGCFSDFVCVTPFQCCKLPAAISFEAAALLEPISVALHAVNLVEAKFTDIVVIFGAGTIGLAIFLVLRRAGIETIYMVDRLPFRRAFAAEFGATEAFPFEDAVAQLKARTSGKGCSLVLDTAGDDASLEACLQSAAAGARVALVAIPEADHLKYNPHQARTKELRLINPHRSTLLLREAMSLFEDSAAASRLERLVSHRMPLADVQAAFEMASGYAEGVMKIMLQPGLPQPRSVGRIGLLGSGVHTSVKYIKRMMDDAGVQVCYVASCEGDHESPHDGLEEFCRQRHIPHLGCVDVTREVPRLAAFGCDLVLAGDATVAACEPEVLQSLAREGVVCTHLGLAPASHATNPVMWAILEAQPQGATTHFVAFGVNSVREVLDMFTIETPPRCKTREVCELLSAEAVRRLPSWLNALGSGIFDMSALRTVRRARGCCGGPRGPIASMGFHSSGIGDSSCSRSDARSVDRPSSCSTPNGAYVSWGWQCAFLERFSDALGTVRTRRDDGTDFFFSVDTASCVQLDALPPPGVVVSAAADSSRFVVRASDGLVTCRAANPAATPPTGSMLESVIMENPEFSVPVDFAGAALTPPREEVTAAPLAPPPPTPVAARPPKATGPAAFTTPTATTQSAAQAPISETPAACGVPIYDLQFEEDFVMEFKEKAAEILTSGRPLSEGKYCRTFEAAFSELVRAPHAMVTTCGTMALTIALRAIGVRGKAVITPSNTFFATQVAVENAGGRVLFAECEPEYMQLCPRALRAQLAMQPAESVAAVVLVHVGGIIAPFAGELRDIAHEHGVALVEDAAHAHLSHLEGIGWAGTIGDIGAFSFFPTKVMTSGEGGMVTTRSGALMKACREIKQFGADLSGSSSRFVCARPDGTNGRVPELSAVLGLMECGRVRRRVVKRQELVAEYARGLAGCEAYRVLQQPGGTCSYYKCIVKLNGIDREFLRAFAKARGVSFTGEVYHLGVHRMPAFITEGEEPEPLATTDVACANHACPPLYPELSIEDVRRVCKVMREAAAAVDRTLDMP